MPASEDVTVDIQLLMTHPKAALLAVLQLLNGWQHAIEDDITVEQFSGAMTNMVYRCGLLRKGREAQVVLMRVHASSSDLFDRAAEIETFRGVSQAGLGPRLLLLFANGRVEEFLSQHVTLAAADLRDPAVSAAIAGMLATFHARMSKVLSHSRQEEGLVQLWERLRQWLALVRAMIPERELQQLGMGGLDKQIDQLEQQLGCQHPCWVALCHNDLQYGNIMALASASEVVGGADSSGSGHAAAAQQRDDAGTGSGAGSLAQQLSALGLGQHNSKQGGADSRSLSTLSVAGSTAAPSVSGLSVHSMDNASSSAALSPVAAPAPSVATATASDGAGLSHAAASEGGSFSSLQLLSRSPAARAVQLPDGSLVLPGMKARPRGQSPEPCRGKRPGSFSSTTTGGSFTGALGAPAAAAAGGARDGSAAAPVSARAAAIAAAHSAAARGDGGAALAVMMQAPSSAAVRRHAADGDGSDHLLLQLAGDDADAAAAALAAQQRRRRRLHRVDSDDGGGYSTDSSDSSDGGGSPGAGGLLMPPLRPGASKGSASQPQRPPPGGPGSSSSGSTSAASSRIAAAVARERPARGPALGLTGTALVNAAAYRSRTGRQYLEARRGRMRPAAGYEFPSLAASDGGSSSGGEGRRGGSGGRGGAKRGGGAAGGDSSSSGLSDDEQRGGGSSSSSRVAGRYGPPSPAGASSSALGAGRSRGRSPPTGSRAPLGPQTPAEAARTAAAAAVAAVAAAKRAAAAGKGGGTAAASGSAAAGAAAAGAAAAGALGAGGGAEVPQVECLTLIDYEYSGFNPVAFDIANHWCEWAADYHTESPHVLDFGRLPDEAQQRAFVEAYLRALLGRLGVALPPEAAASGGGAGPSSHPIMAGGAAAASSSSRRSEAAWSTLSSRGGSVLSMPDTDAAWETASQGSGVAARGARAADHEGPLQDVDEDEEGGGGGGVSGRGGSAGGTLAAPLTGADAKPCTAQLRDVWYWLELALQPGGAGRGAGGSSGSGSSSSRLDGPGWRRLVQQLLAASRAYMAASHLQWALWGVIQSQVSDVEFDFGGYGQQRWRQYLATRPPGTGSGSSSGGGGTGASGRR